MCSRNALKYQLAATILLASIAPSAQAFFDPPWITPTSPMAGETVSINIHGGVCDGIFGEEGYPQITQEGNIIRMIWFGEHWPEGSGDLLCSMPIGTLTRPFGAYPSGSYNLIVDLAYIDFFDGPSILTIGVVPFTVTGLPAPVSVPVPTTDLFGTFSLLVLMLGLVARTLRTRWAGLLIVVIACVPFSQSAHAFFDPPWITPAAPMTDETVSINIHYGVCDGLLEEAGYPQITQEGNAIRMRWYGQHWPEGSGDLLCSFPIATFVAPVGVYPAGSYTLTVDLAYIDFFGAPSIFTVGSVPFTVAGSPESGVPVPAITSLGFSALALGLIGFAVRRLFAEGWPASSQLAGTEAERSCRIDLCCSGGELRARESPHLSPSSDEDRT